MLKGFDGPKFDETVEAHVRLGLNVRHADQQLRGTLMLPHGTGKELRVAVFAEGEKAKEAEEAGADVVGAADLATKIEGGFDDFDVAIATPGPDGHGRQARPHPRPARQDAEPEDRHGHLRRRQGGPGVEGRASSSTAPTAARTSTCRSARRASTSSSLLENYATLIEEIVRAKPSAAKGRYIRTITLATTMGPGVHVDTTRTRGITEELEESADADSAREAARVRPRQRFGRPRPPAAARQKSSGGGLAGERVLSLFGPPSARPNHFRRKWHAESRQGTGRRGADRAAEEHADALRRRLPRPLGDRDRRAAHEAARARRPLHASSRTR